ncbi:hypothetical protein ACQPZP_09875 [Spirillospora sp. CA-142024]|uniref:hypothetical protein n=1 Tax=Spirillospora sp. CA-142024 TaxID=3240036 RepID=UPI003D8CFDD0
MPSKISLGIITPFALAVAAVISAVAGSWLLFTCLSTATAITVSIAVKEWPWLRFPLKGALAIALGIAVVLMLVYMGIEWPWLLGILVVLFGIGFIWANHKRPGIESLRNNRR